MFETGDFQTPAPPESGVADNAVASTPQDHWLYNELVDGFHIDRVVRDYNYSMSHSRRIRDLLSFRGGTVLFYQPADLSGHPGNAGLH